MKRKIAVIMAADVHGYSRLVAADEEGTLARLLALRAVFAEVLGRWDGRIFNTAGDSIFAEFASAVDALRAALAVQDRVEAANLDVAADRHIRFRIGLAIGDVVDQDGDLLGEGVNIASRLEGLAQPGGLCLSRNVFEHVGNKVDVAFRDIGPQTVKNMPYAIHAYTVAGAGCTTDVPPPRSWRRWRVLAGVAVLVLAIVTAGLLSGSHLRRQTQSAAHAGAAAAPNVVGTTVPPAESDAEAAAEPDHFDTFVFPPDAEPPSLAAAPARPAFAASAMPFVSDADAQKIAEAVKGAKTYAVAITLGGIFGIGLADTSIEQAREEALRACFTAGGVNCQLYAENGQVVWPRPLPPMPPRPWVDETVAPTPFDAFRIAGMKRSQKERIQRDYRHSRAHKALALGPRGFWSWIDDKPTAEEAERLALEHCSDRAGIPCLVVAVDDAFVVKPRAP